MTNLVLLSSGSTGDLFDAIWSTGHPAGDTDLLHNPLGGRTVIARCAL